MPLSDDEKLRYARQLGIPSWGEEAQARLGKATVFVAGAGGLGAPVLLYLAAAGVGHLRICDHDRVEMTNLNRQLLHNVERLGQPKVVSAARTVAALNPDIRVTPLDQSLTPENSEELIGDADLLIDCLDNLPARHALNRVAVRKGLPLVHGGIAGYQGQLAFLHPPHTACLACILPAGIDAEPVMVLGATAGVIGSMQALEGLKYLIGMGSSLLECMLFWDGRHQRFDHIRLRRSRHCRVCGGS
ncbi:MAG: HesA/MoeB/ThiF family protein [Acidobacteria bacterium]|nr:HesA/MoeB/ThiF family protein [Acidobacteriota bacterium]